MMFKLAISISLAGFLAIGIILALGHPGFAIRVGNYFFFFLLAVVIFGMFKHE